MTRKYVPGLLVVDVQKDFCLGGSLAVKNGDLVVPPLNKVIRFFDKNDWPIFFSRDWHPSDTEHFKKWPPHCIENTPGAEFHSELLIPGRSYIVTKGTSKKDDGYSPFEGMAYKVKLETFLRAFRVNQLFIGGLATDYCVKAAAFDARALDFRTYLILDACRGVNLNPFDSNKAIVEMKDVGVVMTTTDEILR